MNEEQQLNYLQAQYKICQERGHQPSQVGFGYPEGPTWSVCKWCGTEYRFSKTLHEQKTPGSTS